VQLGVAKMKTPKKEGGKKKERKRGEIRET
jgi:hypothetical protein